jgi:hypothetical protein
MVFGLGVLAHPANGVDADQELRKLDLPAQGAVFAFPPVEVGQCGVYLFIG